MIRKFMMTAVFSVFMTGMAMAQSMSDTQVLQYAKNGMAQGKSQKQLATELAAKGVTRAQAERVKRLYDAQKAKEQQGADRDQQNEVRRRSRSLYQEADTTAVDSTAWQTDQFQEGKKVFGRNIFRNKQLTFEPSASLATPQNYKLGPDDEVIIEIWGASQNTIRMNITPDGYINIPDIGPVFLSGMTVQAANNHLKRELSKIYASINAKGGKDNATTDVRLSLGQNRTIQINIMGEVVNPGTYAVSSFSTVFHALYRAGGVSELGSLRNIKLVRGGRKVATVDVYDYLMRGNSQDDIRLQEGDVVLVSPYEQLVEVEGKVKRPMFYELKSDETVRTLLKYAGGFTNDAYTRSLTIERMTGRELSICTVDDLDYPVFKMHDGDKVTIGEMLKRYENRVEIKGAVYRPGAYQLNGKMNTVKELVEKADGLLEEAFMNRAVLHRQRPDRSLEVVAIDLKGMMDGTAPNVPLQKNDVLYIPSRHDLQDLGTITISGDVFDPGELDYADNMTLEDAVIQAGGLKESASLVRVDVVRRIKDAKSTKAKKEISNMFTFALKDGFVMEGEPGFVLQPYDHVYVRRSPGYTEQKNVRIEGEVEFGGEYGLTQREERLSDLVRKAGGINDFAYTKGARLLRRMSAEERKQMQDILDLAKQNASKQDSVDVEKLDLGDTYYVGIDLEKALKHPGSTADVILREGDVLSVPQQDNTVRISGTVMYPNTVSYEAGKSFQYYISQAGGYGNRAKKSGAYIVYMNGQVKRVGKGSGRDIQPGCQIIVPEKGKSSWSLANTLSVASTTASLATMIATIANILK